jgi:putative aldouronate transport system permease protein
LYKNIRILKIIYRELNMKKSKFSISLAIINIIVVVFSLLILYPFIYSMAYSFSDSSLAMTENIVLFPVGFTLRNYAKVFTNHSILSASMISILRTVIGALWAAIVTSLTAYAVSKQDLPGRKFFIMMFIIPMYISGGLIPYYVLIHDLHLFNNFLVYILPGGFYAFNMLMVRSYYDTIPPSLEESAKIDGAGYFRIFLVIIVPLSMPVLSVILMFTAVSQWNSYFDVVLFITKKNLFPLQTILQNLLQETQTSIQSLQTGGPANNKVISSESVRMSTLMITTIPIVIVYPFFQKHFVKGIMVGAVKA